VTEQLPKDNLKSEAMAGVLWTAVDKVFSQGGQLIISIVLANLLTPDDFGLIGMLAIFLAISQVLIDSGMEKGLIQKLDRSDIDFSTAFIFNVGISLLIYLMLFVIAPFVADFYGRQELAEIIPVMSLVVIINALAIVQRAKMTIAMDFKTFAKIRVLAILIGGATAIILAYEGIGVWALVVQVITTSLISTLLFWLWGRWRLSFSFSKEAFSYLWSYGNKILISGLYGQGLVNAYNIVIGKYYTSGELGFYTNARKYAEVSAGTVTSILQQVTFPILATLQDDEGRLISVYSRLVRMTAFVIFPIMTGIALLAEPIVTLLLNEQWIEMIPILQLMCFVTILYPVSVLNLNVLNAVGRSDLFLKVNVMKSPVMIGTLLCTLPYGVKAIVIGQVFSSFFAFCLNTYYPGKLYGYGLGKHLRDMLPFFVGTVIMSTGVYAISRMIEHELMKLVVCSLVGVVIYICYGVFCKFSEIDEVKKLVQTAWVKVAK